MAEKINCCECKRKDGELRLLCGFGYICKECLIKNLEKEEKNNGNDNGKE